MGGKRVWATTNYKITKCIDDLIAVLFVPSIYPTRDLHSKKFGLKSFEKNSLCVVCVPGCKLAWCDPSLKAKTPLWWAYTTAVALLVPSGLVVVMTLPVDSPKYLVTFLLILLTLLSTVLLLISAHSPYLNIAFLTWLIIAFKGGGCTLPLLILFPTGWNADMMTRARASILNNVEESNGW